MKHQGFIFLQISGCCIQKNFLFSHLSVGVMAVVEFIGESDKILYTFVIERTYAKHFFCILSHHLIEGLRSQEIWQVSLYPFLSVRMNSGLIPNLNTKLILDI